MDSYEEKYKEALERARKLHENSNGMILKKWLWNIFPELKESEDERIRKRIYDYINVTLDDNESEEKEKWLAWLEKQGEQKSVDKVEPKFHVNEWVVTDKNDVVQIKAVNKGYYTIDNGMDFNMLYVDKYWHKWTIDDAKDGDVISDGTTIFIFKDLLSDGSVMSYCDYDTNSGESDAFCPLSMNLMCSKITPTTKEQHDTLMKAMEEAGYKWNEEKKELKEIEVSPDGLIEESYQQQADDLIDMVTEKPAEWSEEDEHRAKDTIYFLDTAIRNITQAQLNLMLVLNGLNYLNKE